TCTETTCNSGCVGCLFVAVGALTSATPGRIGRDLGPYRTRAQCALSAHRTIDSRGDRQDTEVVMSAEVDHSPIVVGVDGSVGSRAAVGWAIDEATRRESPIELVHSWRPMYRTSHDVGGDSEAEMVARDHGAWLLAAAAGSVTSSAPELVVTTRLIKGRPSAGLLEAATNAQFLVVGARGVGGYAGLSLGSVSLHVVAHSPSSVVVVRSAREVGPVIVGI